MKNGSNVIIMTYKASLAFEYNYFVNTHVGCLSREPVSNCPNREPVRKLKVGYQLVNCQVGNPFENSIDMSSSILTHISIVQGGKII